MSDESPDLMWITEAATFLGIDCDTLHYLASREEIPFTRCGAIREFSRAQLTELKSDILKRVAKLKEKRNRRPATP